MSKKWKGLAEKSSFMLKRLQISGFKLNVYKTAVAAIYTQCNSIIIKKKTFLNVASYLTQGEQFCYSDKTCSVLVTNIIIQLT